MSTCHFSCELGWGLFLVPNGENQIVNDFHGPWTTWSDKCGGDVFYARHLVHLPTFDCRLYFSWCRWFNAVIILDHTCYELWWWSRVWKVEAFLEMRRSPVVWFTFVLDDYSVSVFTESMRFPWDSGEKGLVAHPVLSCILPILKHFLTFQPQIFVVG